MSDPRFPPLDPAVIVATRDAMHAYARILGDSLKACRNKRKHWWHASLRPSLNGLSTGVVRSARDFEIDLDFRNCVLHMRSSTGGSDVDLTGQAAGEVAESVAGFLQAIGVDSDAVIQIATADRGVAFGDFNSQHAAKMGEALRSVATALELFRAAVTEETSPVQLWPHHFDLSMIWLPGEKIDGQDPQNEEYSDKQMNFGFAFGDEGIPEPYFYVTAYPSPDAMADVRLPAGAAWRADGFTGAVVTYDDVAASEDGIAYLMDLWATLIKAGREQMLAVTNQGQNNDS